MQEPQRDVAEQQDACEPQRRLGQNGEKGRQAADGGEALRAVISETVKTYAPNLDDFRLAYRFGQVAGAGAIHWSAEQFARIRPLNELLFAGAAEKIAADASAPSDAAAVEPRLMAVLAFLSAIGMLTMNGMVESVSDPLAYSDDRLVDGLARIFEAAVASKRGRG